jgi:hypothetical protein
MSGMFRKRFRFQTGLTGDREQFSAMADSHCRNPSEAIRESLRATDTNTSHRRRVTRWPAVSDGQKGEQATSAKQINVLLNWFEELKRRVPTGTK